MVDGLGVGRIRNEEKSKKIHVDDSLLDCRLSSVPCPDLRTWHIRERKEQEELTILRLLCCLLLRLYSYILPYSDSSLNISQSVTQN